MGFMKIMSDEIQEKDMENILSSIKDILEEDERKQHIVEFSAGETSDDILGDVLNSTDTIDILDLSPDMVVDSQDADFDEIGMLETSEEVYNAPVDGNTVSEPLFEVDENVIIEFDENEPYFEKDNNDNIISNDETFSNIDNLVVEEQSVVCSTSHICN